MAWTRGFYGLDGRFLGDSVRIRAYVSHDKARQPNSGWQAVVIRGCYSAML